MKIRPARLLNRKSIALVKPSRRSAKTVSGALMPARRAQARRHDAQRKIRPRRADAQAIGEFRSALALRVGEVDEISPVRRQRRREIRIRVKRVQAGAFVLKIVVERELFAVRVGQPQK